MICRFNAISTKILMSLFIEIEKKDLKISTKEPPKVLNGQAIMSTRTNGDKRVVLIKQCGMLTRSTEQSPEMNLACRVSLDNTIKMAQ